MIVYYEIKVYFNELKFNLIIYFLLTIYFQLIQFLKIAHQLSKNHLLYEKFYEFYH